MKNKPVKTRAAGNTFIVEVGYGKYWLAVWVEADVNCLSITINKTI